MEHLAAGLGTQEASGQGSMGEALGGGWVDVRGPCGPRHWVLLVNRHEADQEAQQDTSQVSVKVRHGPDTFIHNPVICNWKITSLSLSLQPAPPAAFFCFLSTLSCMKQQFPCWGPGQRALGSSESLLRQCVFCSLVGSSASKDGWTSLGLESSWKPWFYIASPSLFGPYKETS